MCGRFASILSVERLRAAFAITADPCSDWPPRWNVMPGAPAPVVTRGDAGGRALRMLRWGFTADQRRPFNARAETIRASHLFGDPYKRARCLVPVTAFYEWRRDGTRPRWTAFGRMDGRPAALGGVWQDDRFAIMTVDAGSPVRAVHDRAPLLLEAENWPLWLGESDGDPDALLHAASPWVLRAWPVSDAVEFEANEGAGLLAPID